MNSHTVRSLLRIIAVICCVVGFILVSRSVVSLVSMDSTLRTNVAFHAQASTAMRVGIYAILAQLMTSLWGTALYAASGSLAKAIVGREPQ